MFLVTKIFLLQERGDRATLRLQSNGSFQSIWCVILAPYGHDGLDAIWMRPNEVNVTKRTRRQTVNLLVRLTEEALRKNANGRLRPSTLVFFLNTTGKITGPEAARSFDSC